MMKDNARGRCQSMLQSLPRKVCDVENDFAATTLLPQTQVLFNYLLSHLGALKIYRVEEENGCEEVRAGQLGTVVTRQI